MAIGGTNLLFTVMALFIIDRYGRRQLLIVASIGTAACLTVLAYGLASEVTAGGFVLAGLLGFIAFFAISQEAVIWVFISEVFPNRVRSKGPASGRPRTARSEGTRRC